MGEHQCLPRTSSFSLYLHILTEKDDNTFVFFDRSIIDAVKPSLQQGKHFKNVARKVRYHQRVFMLPPWKEIYQSDFEGRHSFEDAVKEYESLIQYYKKFGYEIILVPK